MLFLLNDVVYRLDSSNVAKASANLGPGLKSVRDLEFVIQEMF